MTNRLVIEKSTGRLMLVVSASVPVQLDSIYPPVGYNYLHWNSVLEQQVFVQPWLYYTPQNGGVQLHPEKLSEDLVFAYELNNKKASTLLTLVRAVNRHRRLVVKEWQVGQEIVNVLKYKEATRFLSRPDAGDSLNWLIGDAEHFGISVEQAAVAVIFRHDQQEIVLLESERVRQQLTRSIIDAKSKEDINNLLKRVVEYERKG